MNTTPEIVTTVGDPESISSLTHCATYLRFQLVDVLRVDGNVVGTTDGVADSTPQSGERYQIIVGDAVQTVYNATNTLPKMRGNRQPTDAEIETAVRSDGPWGRSVRFDTSFGLLSGSFRPVFDALSGASLIIAFTLIMTTLKVVGNWPDPKVALSPSWTSVNLMRQPAFTFLPLMMAHNALKRASADPWAGLAIMAFVMLSGFVPSDERPVQTIKFAGGNKIPVVEVFGLPLAVPSYDSQVFLPSSMATIPGLLYKLLKRIVPESMQLMFMPFLTFVVMILLTAFLTGPAGAYVGDWVGNSLGTINNSSPFISAIIAPLTYPFMVPTGPHWLVNAIVLASIASLDYGYVQDPMGVWNFAYFDATVGVLFLVFYDRSTRIRQTTTGALATSLLRGISELSLYGIHLRFEKTYPRMLPGCLVGGLIIDIDGGMNIKAFVFASLLAIPAFNNIPPYVIVVFMAFTTSLLLVVSLNHRTPKDKATACAEASVGADAAAAETPTRADVAPVGIAAAGTSPAEGMIEQSRIEAPFVGLGSHDNVTKLENVASTRLRVEVRNSLLADLDVLNSAGAAGTIEVTPGIWHVIPRQEAFTSAKAASFAEVLAKQLDSPLPQQRPRSAAQFALCGKPFSEASKAEDSVLTHPKIREQTGCCPDELSSRGHKDRLRLSEGARPVGRSFSGARQRFFLRERRRVSPSSLSLIHPNADEISVGLSETEQ